MKNPLGALALLTLGVVCLFGYRLGQRSLENNDIIRDADIAAEMLRSGDWLIPRSCDVVYTEKPPLFIWAVAMSGKIGGAVTPFTARLPSMLSGLMFVLLTVFLGRLLFSWRAGIAAGMALAAMRDVWFYARSARDDMMFAMLVLWALVSLIQGARQGGIASWTAAGLMMAGAMLIKGPLGLGLPLIAFGAWWFSQSQTRQGLWAGAAWSGMLATSMVVLGYYLNVYRHARTGEFEEMVSMFFLKENLERVRSGWDHAPKPFYFYAITLFTNTLPWGLLIIPAAASLWPKRWRGGGAAVFLLLWLGLTVLGFSLSVGKSARYLLPVYPAAALLIGRALEVGFDRLPAGKVWAAELCWLFPFLLLGGGAWALCADPSRFPVPVLLPGLAVLGCACYVVLALRRRDLMRVLFGVGVAVAITGMTWERGMETRDEAESTCRRLAEKVKPHLKENVPVLLMGRDFFRSGLCYYLGRTLPIVDKNTIWERALDVKQGLLLEAVRENPAGSVRISGMMGPGESILLTFEQAFPYQEEWVMLDRMEYREDSEGESK